jgi:hypothetical protein
MALPPRLQLELAGHYQLTAGRRSPSLDTVEVGLQHFSGRAAL